MHEHALIKGLMRQVKDVAAAENARKVVKISVWLGALSHMSPEHFGHHFEEAAAWEFDETRPIVSTPDAVDTLAALGFEQGRLAVRLRRNQ